MGKRARPGSGPVLKEWDHAVVLPVVPDAEHAGKAFVQQLIESYRLGGMSAREICVLCHWATAAGIAGPAHILASPPGRDSGSYQKRLDSALAYSEHAGRLYALEFPGHDKYSASRSTLTTYVQPPHECLKQEFQDNPALWKQAAKHIATDAMPPAYVENPVVQNACIKDLVLPVALYVDGVPYHARKKGYDAVVGWWLCNIISGKRHLIGAIRKSETCCCSCRGWCLFHAMWQFIRWSLEVLSAGSWPSSRHDGHEWRSCDQWRATHAGSSLGFKAACIFLKAD